MTEYHQATISGAFWFFKVNLAERRNNRVLLDQADSLRLAFETTRQRRPFRMGAVVIVLDHLNCI